MNTRPGEPESEWRFTFWPGKKPLAPSLTIAFWDPLKDTMDPPEAFCRKFETRGSDSIGNRICACLGHDKEEIRSRAMAGEVIDPAHHEIKLVGDCDPIPPLELYDEVACWNTDYWDARIAHGRIYRVHEIPRTKVLTLRIEKQEPLA